MSKSIRLSDTLFDQAKKSSVIYHRSPPQQVEHWAEIGRVMESALTYGTQKKVKIAATTEALDAALALPGTNEGIEMAQQVIQQTSGRHQPRSE